MWGSLYYIIVKSSELPGKALAEKLGKRGAGRVEGREQADGMGVPIVADGRGLL